MGKLTARLLIAAAVLAGGAVPPIAIAADDPPAVRPEARWGTGKGFKFDRKETTTRRSLSGVACPAAVSGERRCLAVFDEGVQARYFRNGAKAIDPAREAVELLAVNGELDAEGAATDGIWYYVTGSHSAKRATCDSNTVSRHVIRFRVDPQTGRALRDTAGRLVGYTATNSLWAIMGRLPELRAHVGENACLGTEAVPDVPSRQGRRGVNIEGLAVRDGRLLFGFRGPARDGTALVLSVDAEPLFSGGDARPRVVSFAVGPGRGVRDLLAVSDGILVLAGPDDDRANEGKGWVIGRFDDRAAKGGAVAFKPLAGLDLSGHKRRDCDGKEIKPEALASVSDEPGKPYRVLVFSDGLCDGGPMSFVVPR